MRTKIIDLLRRAVGIKQIFDRLDRIERKLSAKMEWDDASQPTGSALEILPGTEYSRYA